MQNTSKATRQKELIMENKKNGKNTDRSVDGRYSDFTGENGIPGINTPGIELPAFNPPVPNRAWTAMRKGLDIDELDEVERDGMYDAFD